MSTDTQPTGIPNPQIHTMPPADLLQEIFSYDPITGDLRYANDPDAKAVKVTSKGKRVVKFEGSEYRAARVIWSVHTGDDIGVMPVEQIDGDLSNFRWDNLRLVPKVRRKEWVTPEPEKGYTDWAADHIRARSPRDVHRWMR